MTEEQVERSRRRFEIAGAIICAHCFGYFLWSISLRHSIGPPSNAEYAGVIGYIALTLSCYLGAYWFLDRYCILPFQSIRPNWICLSFLGTSLSLTITSIPRMLSHTADTPGEFLLGFLFVLGVFNLLMLPVMAVVWSAGFLARLVRREIEYARVVTD
jgi:hypothetical protein